MKTTAKSTKHNIAGMVTYESIGYVFPIGDPESPVLCTDPGSACAFGPLGVSQDDFKKLASLHIQFVWGDHRTQAETAPFNYQQVLWSRLCAKMINEYAAKYKLPGHAEVLMLGEDTTLRGNTHIAFMDMNNDKVAILLDQFLKKSKLDGYQRPTPWGVWRWLF